MTASELNYILNHSVKEIMEHERRANIRRFKDLQGLCLDMEQQIKTELVIDEQRLGRDARSCLRAFYTLFELAIRDMAEPEEGYYQQERHADLPDWFEVNRRNTMGNT